MLFLEFTGKEWLWLALAVASIIASLAGYVDVVYVLAGVIILVLAAFVVADIVRRFRHHEYPFKILESFVVLGFASQTDGSLAHYVKEQRLLCLQDQVPALEEAVSCDGKVEGVSMYLWDAASGTRLDTSCERSPRGYRHVFQQHPTKGRIYRRVVMWTFRDSYPKDEEGYTLTLRQPTERVRFTILFPYRRPPKDVTVSLLTLTGKKAVPRAEPLTLPEGRVRFSFSLPAQHAVGTDYDIKWRW
ncbi:MAG: hypothetical protein O7B35_03680 [Deltaproteobacteria bacterium]|nr:hypothetical protein [Deltaproteobacteria bacterium]